MLLICFKACSLAMSFFGFLGSMRKAARNWWAWVRVTPVSLTSPKISTKRFLAFVHSVMVFLLGSQSSIQKLCISEIVMFALFRTAQSAAWWASVEGTVLSMWSRATIAIARPRRRRHRSFRAARSVGVRLEAGGVE